ncbi:DUF654-domain-containing protein [Dentipellis sp. KUC8613]|nr:DUF654-domain-containing protein [Dentipellis sp. KUC8613]
MAPRLSKRQQRELEELSALSGAPGLELEPSSEDDVDDTHLVVPGKSGFAALMSDEVEDDESGRKTKKPKKKKKKESRAGTPAPHPPLPVAEEKPIPAAAPSPPQSQATPPGPSKKERKALKKQKAKEKNEVDEIDKALQELSTKYPDLKRVAANPSSSTSPASHSFSSDLAPLLAVSLTHLDPEVEFRKFFGKKVVEASRSSSAGPSTPSGAGGRRTQRSNLTRPKREWGPAQTREGLTVRALSEDELAHKMEVNGWEPLEERWWTVEYSKRYRGATKAFMDTVYSGNPDGLFAIYRRMPWHADTLMQLAEVQSHREDHSQAADLIERALFAYERAFVGAFNFTSGSNRLDFDHAENRPFFLAIHRQIINLERRRVMRTTFEFARLLYGLEPWTDPHGALLWLDFLAIKAGMNQWLLDMYALFESHVSEKDKDGPLKGRVSVLALPGWAYAKALALRARGGAESAKESTEALKQAIMAFPSVVPLLADKADISLSSEVRGHSAFRIFVPSWTSSEPESVLHLLSNIYAQRSFSIWKEPEHSTWLAQTASSLVSSSSLPSSVTAGTGHAALTTLLRTSRGFAPSVYRHVLVLTAAVGGTALAQRLRPFVPQAASATLACDPLPPPTRVSTYDAAFFSGAEDVFAPAGGARLGPAATQRLLERLVPDPELRRQLQAIFEGNPAIRRQFPGGVVEFAQAAGQMPEEVLDDILMGAAMVDNAGAREGGMPGAMPGQEGLVELEFLEGGDVDDVPAEAHVEHPVEEGDVDEGEEEEEEEEEEGEEGEEEEEYVAPMPVRILRNLVNRFWGTTATAANEEDSEEEADGEEGHEHQ